MSTNAPRGHQRPTFASLTNSEIEHSCVRFGACGEVRSQSHFVRAAATVSKQTTWFCFSFASFCTLVSIFHRGPDQDSVQEIYQTIVLYPRCHWSPQPFRSRLFTKCLSLRNSLSGAQYFSIKYEASPHLLDRIASSNNEPVMSFYLLQVSAGNCKRRNI